MNTIILIVYQKKKKKIILIYKTKRYRLFYGPGEAGTSPQNKRETDTLKKGDSVKVNV